MPLICPHCGAYALMNPDRSPDFTTCSMCGERTPSNIFPLLVVTGASGSGKTVIIPYLRAKLTNLVIFDKDLLWGRCGDQFYNNWLRIAYSLAQQGRHTLICGIVMPSDFEACEDRNLVGTIHYLNLHCSDAIREERLRSRPAWRQSGSDWFVEEHRQVAQRLLELSSAYDPPMPTIDTSATPPDQIARSITKWAHDILRQYRCREPAYFASSG
jgi:hypothetical protein